MKKNTFRVLMALFCLMIAAPALTHAADTVADKDKKVQSIKPKKKHKKPAAAAEEAKDKKVEVPAPKQS